MPFKKREEFTAADRAYNLKHDPVALKYWINEITGQDPGKFSSWEIDFVESVERQLDSGRTLTDKQVERLEEIYNKF